MTFFGKCNSKKNKIRTCILGKIYLPKKYYFEKNTCVDVFNCSFSIDGSCRHEKGWEWENTGGHGILNLFREENL